MDDRNRRKGRRQVIKPRNAEEQRLLEDAKREKNWKRWGPYLSERQWGTVREDYSAWGDCWDYFPHDHARSRAYRWGEDGLLGITRPRVPPVLRARALERARPDPQGAPLRPDRPGRQPRRGRQGVLLLPRLHADALLHEGALQVPAGGVPVRRGSSRRTRRRGKDRPGVRARGHGRLRRQAATSTSSRSTPRPSPDDLLIRITVANRGPEAARLHVLPTLWFRNTWSWGRTGEGYWPKPRLAERVAARRSIARARRRSARTGSTRAPGPTAACRSSCSRRTRPTRGASSAPRTASPYVKDAFHEYVVHGRARRGQSRTQTGTKAAAHYVLDDPGRRRGGRSSCGLAADAEAPARRVRRRVRRDVRRARCRRRTRSTTP